MFNDHQPYLYCEFNNNISIEVGLQLLKGKGFYHVKQVERYHPIGFQKKPCVMYQVFVNSPKDIREARERISRIPNIFKIYEADIQYRNRVLIDKGLGGFSEIGEIDDSPMKYMGFDIEVLVPETGKFPDSANDPVIIISMSFSPTYNDASRIVLTTKVTSYEGCPVIICKDEKDLISTFIAILNDQNPDIVAGYNSNEFDFQYLNARCKKLGVRPKVTRDHRDWYIRPRFDGGIDVTITGRVVVDLLPIIRKSYSLPQYTLRETAKLVKYEKLDVSPKEMREAYLNVICVSNNVNDIDSISAWNRTIGYADRDAELVMKLMLDLKIVDKYVALSKASGLLLQDIINGGQSGMIEALLIRRFRAANRVMAMRPQFDDEVDEDEIRYEGATVLTPPIGLQEDLVILDYKSLYPTIVIAHNISYDTLDIDGICPNDEVEMSPSGAKFVQKSVHKGIMPEILEELLNERIATKKLMKQTDDPAEKDYLDAKQNAMKILLNSFYGYAGYIRARLFTIEVAESVTSWGRDNIEDTIQFIKSEGYDVVYGDTDSVFVRCKITDSINQGQKLDELKRFGTEIACAATKRLLAPMELVFEAIALRAIFLAKKHYAMWRFEPSKNGWDSKLKAKGIAMARRDWCPLTGKTMKACLESILIDGDVQTAAQNVHKIIVDLKHLDIKNAGEYLELLQMTKRYGGDIAKYKNKPIHIKLIERKMARGEPEPSSGDRIPFIVINEYSGTFSNKGEDPEYAVAHGYTLDTEYYLKKQLLSPLADVFESFGITAKMLEKGVYTREDKLSKQKTLFDI